MFFSRVALAVSLLFVLLGSGSVVAKEPSVVATARWKVLSAKEIREEVNDLILDRHAHVQRLIEIVENEDPDLDRESPWFRVAAVVTLGQLRAFEATDALVAHIESIQPPLTHGTLGGQDSCVNALVNIGKPASRACLAALATEDNSSRRNRMVRVIHYVERHEVGTFLLQRAIDKEKDAAKQANLQAAMRMLQAEHKLK